MVHLMPFVLRLTIDQRRLDALLADLAQAPLPIDVREVRINAQGQRGGAGIADGPQGTDDKRSRSHDVHVELRGTVGLATPPSAVAVGIEPPAPAATDAAATTRRWPTGRRLGRRVMA